MASRSKLESILFLVVLPVAAHFVAPASTPIDRALPFAAFLLAVVCVSSEAPRLCGLCASLILFPPILFTAEHDRLLAYGVAAAITFAIAVAATPPERLVVITLCGVLLLRWIPMSNVVVWRELVILAIAAAMALVWRTPGGVIAALAVALATPVFPARAMLFAIVALAFVALVPKPRVSLVLRAPVYAAACALLVLWPWSGLAARALPPLLRAEPEPQGSIPLWIALQPGESVSLDVPPRTRTIDLTLSGANAEKLPNGTLMGTVDGLREIRIGDIADFGYTRREQFFHARNPELKRPIDDIKDYGQAAWLHTAGIVTVHTPRGTKSIRISAARTIPADTRLQIEAVVFR